MKKVSAGLILTDKQYFLGCHSTGNNFYDIPKGSIESGETPIEACIREVKEETGLDVSKENLIDLGMFDYNFEKNLHLFLLISDNLPDLNYLNCTSYFFNPKIKKHLPEIDYYRYVPFSNKKQFVTENMRRVITKIESIMSDGLNKKSEAS